MKLEKKFKRNDIELFNISDIINNKLDIEKLPELIYNYEMLILDLEKEYILLNNYVTEWKTREYILIVDEVDDNDKPIYKNDTKRNNELNNRILSNTDILNKIETVSELNEFMKISNNKLNFLNNTLKVKLKLL